MIIEATLSLSLLCSVAFSVSETSTAQTQFDHGTPPVMTQSSSSRPANGQAYLELGPTNRFRFPRQLVGSRDAGWRDLRDVTADDRTIQAKFTFSPTLNGSLSVDRTTGEIRARWGNFLWGTDSLGGECRPYEQPSTRLF